MSEYDIFEDYVTVKSNQLIDMMDEMIGQMNSQKCNVRHFKQWEAKMTSFKEEYHLFQSNLLSQINDVQDSKYAKQLETVVEPICERLEDRYEMLASVYLSKRNEIKNKTTYFENLQTKSKDDNIIWKLVRKINLPTIKITIQKRKK